MHAHIVSDFSVLSVAMNSHSAKPMLYKVAGTWGNHEGSMLLWVLILAIFGAAVAAFGGNLPAGLRARALAVQAWIAVGFYLFILFTSNPFARVEPPPIDGRGLNPLLQDPGLAFHPPFLYLGYVGFSMAFSFAVAALIEGRVDASWARWVRPWTLAAWVFLTCGIALGSWWAYYELGWGGWWYWDPVENASLLPWLSGTALLHSAIVVEKRDALKGWTVFLAIVTFSLSLLGTFLVRSGVLTSVHAFAVDPARGIFILALLVIVIGGSFALFAWRGPQLPAGGLFSSDLARGRPAAEQPAAERRRRLGAARHPLPAAARSDGWRQGVGRTAVLRRRVHPADGAAGGGDGDRPAAAVEARRSRRCARPAVAGGARRRRRGAASLDGVRCAQHPRAVRARPGRVAVRRHADRVRRPRSGCSPHRSAPVFAAPSACRERRGEWRSHMAGSPC